ncbi:Presenilin-1, partial [Quaeritorhiza haematococci]
MSSAATPAPISAASNGSPTPATCKVCGKPAQFMCSKCGPGVQYCSQECQTADWKEHKQSCRGYLASQQKKRQQQQQQQQQAQQQQNAQAAVGSSSRAPVGGEGVNSNATAPAGSHPSLNRNYGRGGAAQILNQKRSGPLNWIKSFFSAPSSDGQGSSSRVEGEGEELTPEERREELRFYTRNIYSIIKPVMICIFLSIFWVKLTRPAPDYYEVNAAIPTVSYDVGGVFAGEGGGGLTSSLVGALLILAQIIVATIIILCLVKYGCVKILNGIFFVMVLGIFGLFGYILGTSLFTVLNVPVDYVTFFFCLWNLCVVGVIQIFWKGPRILNKAYLVVMSSLMAFALTSLPDLTTWILLGLLVIWDLVAVLCPFGPLRILVETSKQQSHDLQAILYAVMIWMMASPPDTPRHTNNTITPPQPALLSSSQSPLPGTVASPFTSSTDMRTAQNLSGGAVTARPPSIAASSDGSPEPHSTNLS